MIEQRNLAPSISELSDCGDDGNEVADGSGSLGLPAAEGVSLRAVLAGLDLIAVSAVWMTEILLRHRQSWQPVGAVVAIGVTLVALRGAGLYRSRVCAVRSTEAVRATLACLLGGGAFEGFERVTGESTTVPTLQVALAAAAVVVVMRWCFGRWLKARRSGGRSLRTVLLVGTNGAGLDLWTTLTSEPELGFRVGAVVGAERPDAPWADLPGSSSVWDIPILAAKVGATGVIWWEARSATRCRWPWRGPSRRACTCNCGPDCRYTAAGSG